MNGNTPPHDRLLAAHAEAQRLYRQQLLTSTVAEKSCHYLVQRRLAHVLSPDSVWQVGYAPAGWTDLRDHLTNLSFDEEELLVAGLVSRTRRRGVVDRFRDRIMLSQLDQAGQVVGSIGRAAMRYFSTSRGAPGCLRIARRNRFQSTTVWRRHYPAAPIRRTAPGARAGSTSRRTRRLLSLPLAERATDARIEAWAPVLDGIDGRIAAVKAVAPLFGKLPENDVAQQLIRLADRVNHDVTVGIAVTDALSSRPGRFGSTRSRSATYGRASPRQPLPGLIRNPPKLAM